MISILSSFFNRPTQRVGADAMVIKVAGVKSGATSPPKTSEQRKKVARKSATPKKPSGLRVENDVGGPTSVYRGSVQGIGRIVLIGHNRQRGVKLDTGVVDAPDSQR
jgi:hypothetical protein